MVEDNKVYILMEKIVLKCLHNIQIRQLSLEMIKQAVGHLLNFLQEVLQSENAISQVKKDMIKLTGYHPNVVFNQIVGNNYIISIAVFQQYLKDRVACNSRQLYELFQRLDSSRKGYISQIDFEQYMTQSGQFMKKKSKNNRMTHQIQLKFILLLNLIIKNCRVLDVWRKQLECARSYDLFKLINRSITGVIGPAELFHFFYENGKQLNQHKSKLLHKYLLRGYYNQLTLEVFCENLNPLQFGQYPSYRANLELIQRKEQIQIKVKCIQVKEAQHHYYKQRVNQKVKEEIQRQAVLTREEQLEKRIQDQIRTYNQLKFITKRKYHPNLTNENCHLFDKENIDRYNMHLKAIEEEARLKEEAYRRKINNADVVMAVEAFKSQKKEDRIYPATTSCPHQKVACQAELQKLIKKYAFSQINPHLKSKRKFQRDVLGESQINLY